MGVYIFKGKRNCHLTFNTFITLLTTSCWFQIVRSKLVLLIIHLLHALLGQSINQIRKDNLTQILHILRVIMGVYIFKEKRNCHLTFITLLTTSCQIKTSMTSNTFITCITRSVHKQSQEIQFNPILHILHLLHVLLGVYILKNREIVILPL